MNPGEPVTWKGQRTYVRSLETIIRADRTPLECAVLECNRFAAEEKLEIPAHLVTDYLALCGDTSDGIPGVKGIGPKTAATLLQEFDSLENILAAATLGRIKGANGTKLKEQREAALLCRRVVELNSRLPLPELADWRPATGWQQRLTDVRLGSCAAIVDAIKDQRFVSGERQGVSPPRGLEQGDRVNAQDAMTVPLRTASSPVLETRRADAQPLAVEAFQMDIECLMVLAEDVAWTTPEASAVTCWHAGRKGKLRNAENPWRVGTWEHVAWAQGSDGVPLCVSLRDDRPQRHEPVAETSTSTQKAGSLF